MARFWPRSKARDPRHHIDSLHFFQGGLNIVGWAEDYLDGGDPVIVYNKVPLKTMYAEIDRPDLVEPYGEAARKWGFRIVALIGDMAPSLEDVQLSISGGIIKLVPLSDEEDANFQRMSEGFFNQVRENPTGAVLEIGARGSHGRRLFPDTVTYLGFDITAGPNVDLVGDAHHLTRYIHQKVDFVMSFVTFEHLLMPWKVVVEINHLLAPGGLVMTHAPQTWSIHHVPWDYWRISRDGWRGLFNRYTGFEILQTAYAKRAVISPANMVDQASGMLPGEPAYLMTGCVARKTGEPSVSWDVEASEIADLAYSW